MTGSWTALQHKGSRQCQAIADAARAWEALLAQGVLVRDVGIAHHLRVTAGTPEETTAFLDAMAGLPGEHRLDPHPPSAASQGATA